MVEKPEQNSARSAIILVVIIIVVAIFSSSYGMQTLQWIAARQWAEINPWLNDVPQPLAAASGTAKADAAFAAAPVAASRSKAVKIAGQPTNTELTAYQYEFNVPWTGKWKERPSAGGAEFKFDSGQVVVFADPEAQLDTLQILRTSTSLDYLPFQSLVNESGITTNYSLFQAIYGAAPSHSRPLMSYAAAQRERVLLLTKLGFGFDIEGKISSFDFGSNRGFQFGDPAKGPVALRVFNARDHQFRFLFTEFVGSGAQITQDDIDQAIQSLQVEPFETK
jgi:hypothetical protein